MKYFTSEWWASGGEDPPNVIEEYQTYLASIRAELPTKLVAFLDNHTLHDARVKRIVTNLDNRAVTMELNGWNLMLEYPVRYVLHFSGVSRFDQQLPQKGRFGAELGDLGYWEIEALDSTVEARMLFASSAEFCIVFRGFEFEHSPIES